MTSIFYNKDIQKQFDQNGYVLIDLLSINEVEKLNAIYNSRFNKNEFKNFTSTNFLHSKEQKLKVAKEIATVINIKLKEKLKNIFYWYPAFLIKPSGKNTLFEIHQDWTFVDESKYRSGNIWIPLQDTGIEEGTLFFIPKSHFPNIKNVRGQTVNYFYKENEEFLRKFAKPIKVQKGQALIFNHSVFHFSSNNLTNKNRIAISCGFNSIDATLLYYTYDTENSIKEYFVPDNFVFNFNSIDEINNLPTHAIYNKTIPFKNIINTKKELNNIFKNL